MAWDGAYLWLANFDGNVYGFDLEGTMVGSFSTPTIRPMITWDGQYFLVASIYDHTIMRIDHSGDIKDVFYLDHTMDIHGLTWVPTHNGHELWIAAHGGVLINAFLEDGTADENGILTVVGDHQIIFENVLGAFFKNFQKNTKKKFFFFFQNYSGNGVQRPKTALRRTP